MFLQHFQLFQFHFAVTANEFRLLNNFSVTITAQALTQAYIIIVIQNRTFSHTFTPSSNYKGSFAFINGFEIISMPEILHSAKMMGL